MNISVRDAVKAQVLRLRSLGADATEIDATQYGPGAKDVNDQIAKYGAASMMAILGTTPPAPPALFEPIGDWLSRPIPADREIVKDMVFAGAITSKTGEAKGGKTWSAMDLGIAVAAGQPFLGRATVQGSVAFALEEDSPAKVYERMSKLAFGRKVDLAKLPIVLAVQKGLRLDTPDGFKAIAEFVETHKLTALLLDGFRRLTPSKDENALGGPNGVGPILYNLQRLAVRSGCAIVLLHHTRKRGSGRNKDTASAGERIAGTNAFHAVVRSNIAVERTGHGTWNVHASGNYADSGAISVKIVDVPGGGVVLAHAPAELHATDAGPDLQARVLAQLAHGPMSATALADSLHTRKGSVLAVVDALIAAGRLQAIGVGPRRKLAIGSTGPSVPPVPSFTGPSVPPPLGGTETGTDRPGTGNGIHAAIVARIMGGDSSDE